MKNFNRNPSLEHENADNQFRWSLDGAYPMTFEGSSKSQKIETKANEKKSKKPVSACSNCKNSHLGCDYERPCQRCVKKGFPERCTDADHKKRGRKPTKIPVFDQKRTRLSPTMLPLPTNGTETLHSESDVESWTPKEGFFGVSLDSEPIKNPFSSKVPSMPLFPQNSGFQRTEHLFLKKTRRIEQGEKNEETSKIFDQLVPINTNPFQKSPFNNINNSIHHPVGHLHQPFQEQYTFKEVYNYPSQIFSSRDPFSIDSTLDLNDPVCADLIQLLFSEPPSFSFLHTKEELKETRAMEMYKTPPWSESTGIRITRFLASGGLTAEDLTEYGRSIQSVRVKRRKLYNSLSEGERILVEQEFNDQAAEVKRQMDNNPTPAILFDYFGIIHHMNAPLLCLSGFSEEIPTKDPIPMAKMFRLSRESYLKVRFMQTPIEDLKFNLKLPIVVPGHLRIFGGNHNLNVKLKMGPEGEERYVEGTIYADVKYNRSFPVLSTYYFMPHPSAFVGVIQ